MSVEAVADAIRAAQDGVGDDLDYANMAVAAIGAMGLVREWIATDENDPGDGAIYDNPGDAEAECAQFAHIETPLRVYERVVSPWVKT